MFQLISNFLDLFDLPDDIEWYEVDGRKLFELRTGGAGLNIKKIAYLIKRPVEKDDPWYKYGIVFDAKDQLDRQCVINKVQYSINEFQLKIAEKPPSNVDLDEGELGLDGF